MLYTNRDQLRLGKLYGSAEYLTLLGKIPSDRYNIGADKATRQGNVWHRSMFPTDEKKGWFNKLISKKRSGTMTMQERVDMVTNYLGKYDSTKSSWCRLIARWGGCVTDIYQITI